ncbi:hypothetical protein Hanom_Chr12g01093831 [Helianthus anomalus]
MMKTTKRLRSRNIHHIILTFLIQPSSVSLTKTIFLSLFLEKLPNSPKPIAFLHLNNTTIASFEQNNILCFTLFQFHM